jgi:hypothetical protein
VLLHHALDLAAPGIGRHGGDLDHVGGGSAVLQQLLALCGNVAHRKKRSRDNVRIDVFIAFGGLKKDCNKTTTTKEENNNCDTQQQRQNMQPFMMIDMIEQLCFIT